MEPSPKATTSYPSSHFRKSILNIKWRMKFLFSPLTQKLEGFDGMQIETFGEVMQLDALRGRWLPVSKY